MHITIFTITVLLGLTAAFTLPKRAEPETDVCPDDRKAWCCDVRGDRKVVACEYPGRVGSIDEFEEACEKLDKEPKCCSTGTDSLVDSTLDFSLDSVMGSAKKDDICEDI